MGTNTRNQNQTSSLLTLNSNGLSLTVSPFQNLAYALHTNTDEIQRVSAVIPQRADFNEIIMVVDSRALAAQTTFDAWVTTTGIKSFVCLQ